MMRAACLAVATLTACGDDGTAAPDPIAGEGGAGGSEVIDCPLGDKPGSAAGADGMITAGGIHYNVRVPADYAPTHAHPLLVVYSPHATNETAADLEAFTGLGPDATARGYIAAFAEWFDPVPSANQQDADTIRLDVAESWCVDETRVYFTGHSDGGSITTLLALFGAPVAAVAPSAAGIDETNGPAIGCEGAIPAMVIHSSGDTLFPVPEFGAAPAEFWAGCSSCGDAGAPRADGCVPYSGCAEGSEVLYCETTGGHYEWYGLNLSMLDFFDRHVRPSP